MNNVQFNTRQSLPVLLQLLLLLLALVAATQLLSFELNTAAGTVYTTFYGGYLRQTSDDLTRMARLNAISGDPLYRQYFDEVLAIRNGDMPRPLQYFEIPWWDIVLSTGERPTAPGETISLRDLLAENVPGEADLAPLFEAEDYSNALTALEYEVMDQVAALREATGGDYVLEGAALENMLRLHGPEYHDGKERVMRPLMEFAQNSRQQLSAYGREFFGLLARNLVAVIVAVVLSLLLCLWTLWRRRGRRRQALMAGLQLLLLLLTVVTLARLPVFNLGEFPELLNIATYAYRLRRTSDDLTRMARLNAITGDPLYREYFDEVLAIRNGDLPRPEPYHEIPWWDIVLATGERPSPPGEPVAMRQFFMDSGIAGEQLALLLEAEDQSNLLTELEYEVMDNVAAYREAAGGDYALEGEALDNMLRLHGEEYHQAKEGIMRPLVELTGSVWQRVEATVDRLLIELPQSFALLVAAIALAFLSGVGVLLAQRDRSA
ncbi:MAG: hypothetical protein OXF44_04435 [Anaerolineaceae bacterium]|nr:hypothetical protein [Anaerolineaceae bacterium]MCY4022376.1 hypothetical protein [Anaerolineaceae bacterium]